MLIKPARLLVWWDAVDHVDQFMTKECCESCEVTHQKAMNYQQK